MSESDLPLLNIYEVETVDGIRHLIGFLDPVLAGSIGIDSRAMIGEFTPGPDGDFDAETFEINPEFIDAFTEFMNEQTAHSPELVEGARSIPGQRLYLVDPRNQTESDEDPPSEDVLGCFSVDDSGQIVPDSFEYNEEHLWFSPESGVSGILYDRNFYDWLHPESVQGDGSESQSD